MAEPAPRGPLVGHELAVAIETLTDKQLRAYRYYRDGQHTNGWIAARLGVSRQAVMQLVVKSEKKLGYAPSFTPKKKAPYKPAADRRSDQLAAQAREVAAAFAAMTAREQARFLRSALPGTNTGSLDDKARLRLFARVVGEALTDDAARDRLGARVRPLERRAQRGRAREHQAQLAEADRERDGFTGRYLGDSSDVQDARRRGQQWTLEDDFGFNGATDEPLRPSDLVVDDGAGHNRV